MIRYSIIIFIIFSLLACRQQDKDYEAISRFMQEHYGYNLKDKDITLVFIPGNQCLNCIDYTAIDSVIRGKDYRIITNISPERFRKYKDHLIHDRDNAMMFIKQNRYSNAVWTIKDNKVLNIEAKVAFTGTAPSGASTQ